MRHITSFIKCYCAILMITLECLPAAAGESTTGLASFYAGLPSTAGNLTAAHRHLPFGTRVRVTRIDTGKNVVVRINDRGPFVGGRIIDLSQSAAERLGMKGAGVARVKVEVVAGGAAR